MNGACRILEPDCPMFGRAKLQRHPALPGARCNWNDRHAIIAAVARGADHRDLRTRAISGRLWGPALFVSWGSGRPAHPAASGCDRLLRQLPARADPVAGLCCAMSCGLHETTATALGGGGRRWRRRTPIRYAGKWQHGIIAGHFFSQATMSREGCAPVARNRPIAPLMSRATPAPAELCAIPGGGMYASVIQQKVPPQPAGFFSGPEPQAQPV